MNAREQYADLGWNGKMHLFFFFVFSTLLITNSLTHPLTAWIIDFPLTIIYLMLIRNSIQMKMNHMINLAQYSAQASLILEIMLLTITLRPQIARKIQDRDSDPAFYQHGL